MKFNELHSNLKEELAKLNPKGKNDELKLKIHQMTIKIMEKLIVNMILNSDEFYGNFIVQLEKRIDFMLKAPAAVCFENDVFYLIVNPVLFAKYDKKQMTAIMKHELHHIVNDHLLRAKNFPNTRRIVINYAADAAINQHIPDIPQDCVFVSTIEEISGVSPLELNREFEYYLKYIDNKDNELPKNQNKQKSEKEDSEGDQDGQPNSGEGGQESSPSDDSQKSNPEKDYVDETDMNNNHDSWEGATEDVEDTYNSVLKEMLDEAVENLKNRDNIPSDVQEKIKKLNTKPEIKWQNVLKKFVGNIPSGEIETSTRFNRRMPYRTDLKGFLSDTMIRIFIALDTSGSMSEEDLAYALNEIVGIVKNVNAVITIIEFDSRIQHIYDISDKRQVNFTVNGRGGTYVTPVLEYLKEQKEKESILIIFTDGGVESEIPRPYNRHTMWVLTDPNYNLFVNQPYGPVARLRLEDKKGG